MRADRLISIILILQQRKKVNAEKLADELGVSVRTIYRDLMVLSSNGFPIYAEHGPGGGICIIENYQGGVKTLTSDELDALQLIQIPDSISSLETGKTLQRALLKMFASLPERSEHPVNMYIDWNWWKKSKNDSGGRLGQIYSAVCNCQTIHVRFPLWNGMAFEQDIDPHGLVSKAGEWYLVYVFSERYRMRRISTFTNIVETDRFFTKPEHFDLESIWKQLCVEEESSSNLFRVDVRLSKEIVTPINEAAWSVPCKISGLEDDPGSTGWMHGTLEFENIISARNYLLKWGNAIEVISPEALRSSMLDFANQVRNVYLR